MKIADIVPIPFLDELSSGGDIGLALAHQVLASPKCSSFFQKFSRHKRVILDNGAFELGKPVTLKSLSKAADIFHDVEVVLPDVFHDGPETWKRAKSAIRVLKRPDRTLMAVPQGATEKEWWTCLDRIYGNWDINTIGIGFKTMPWSTSKYPRVHILEQLEKKGYVGKTMHLLGGGVAPYVDLYAGSQYPFVRSCDTSIPFIAGLDGVKLTPNYVRPSGRTLNQLITRLSPKKINLIKENMRILRTWRCLKQESARVS